MRSDARRSRDRLVAAAEAVVAKDGARASLEEIARRAGVGSATLHRHFPSRRALLDAVFHDGVERLCARADEFADAAEPGAGLERWLEELTVYSAATRGVADALLAEPGGRIRESHTCHGMVRDAAARLVDRALGAAAIRPGTTADDLLILANAISVATQHDPETARRLLLLALGGVRAGT